MLVNELTELAMAETDEPMIQETSTEEQWGLEPEAESHTEL